MIPSPPLQVRLARALLGAALHLFLRDKDPYSVHALACGGSELIEGLAETAGLATLSKHIMGLQSDIDMRKIRGLRNQYWNAIKHFYNHTGKTAREDEELMADFSDVANDAVLFMGWLDYMMLVNRLLIEVQVFQVWWYATNESRMNPDADPTSWSSVFTGIAGQYRQEQKRRMRRTLQKYRKYKEILTDMRTEAGPLLIAL